MCDINSIEKAKEAIFYSYTRHINGFAAILEDEEAEELSSKSFFFPFTVFLIVSFLLWYTLFTVFEVNPEYFKVSEIRINVILLYRWVVSWIRDKFNIQMKQF